MNGMDLFMTLCFCVGIILLIGTEISNRKNKKKKKKSYYGF